MRISDWSSDVCSSDLRADEGALDLDLDLASPQQTPQSQAAQATLHHPLLLVTRGPDTGKTTPINRMPVLLVAQARPAGTPHPTTALADNSRASCMDREDQNGLIRVGGVA